MASGDPGVGPDVSIFRWHLHWSLSQNPYGLSVHFTRADQHSITSHVDANDDGIRWLDDAHSAICILVNLPGLSPTINSESIA